MCRGCFLTFDKKSAFIRLNWRQTAYHRTAATWPAAAYQCERQVNEFKRGELIRSGDYSQLS